MHGAKLASPSSDLASSLAHRFGIARAGRGGIGLAVEPSATWITPPLQLADHRNDVHASHFSGQLALEGAAPAIGTKGMLGIARKPTGATATTPAKRECRSTRNANDRSRHPPRPQDGDPPSGAACAVAGCEIRILTGTGQATARTPGIDVAGDADEVEPRCLPTHQGALPT